MKAKIILFAGALALASLYPLVAEAQTQDAGTTVVYDPIIVTATRGEQAASKEGKSITVIDAKEIRDGGKQTLADILESIPGLVIYRTGAYGGLTKLFMRGGRGGHVLVLIDGARIGDSTGAGGRDFDVFAMIQPENIERIEIVRGAMSSLYGSEASGGVVNIITKKGDGSGIRLYGEVGSRSTVSGGITAEGAGEKSSFFASVAGLHTNGVSKAKRGGIPSYDDDGFKLMQAAGKLNINPTEAFRATLAMNYSDTKADMDDGTFEDDVNRVYTQKLFSTRSEITHDVLPWLSYKAGLSYMTAGRADKDPMDSADIDENDHYTFNSSNISGDLLLTFSIADINKIILGGELLREKGDTTSTYYSTWPTPGVVSDISPAQTMLTKSLFIRDSFFWNDMIFLNAGARLDHHKDYGPHVTWDGAAAFVVPVIQTKLRASAGSGFRAPTLYELYSSYGNKDLNPEESMTVDAGVSQELWQRRIVLDIGWFYQRYKEMIAWGTSRYENISGSTSNNGIELSASCAPIPMLKLSYGFTWLHFRKSDKALRRPEFKHSISASIKPITGLTIALNWLYVGQRNDAYYNPVTYTTENKTLSPYNKIDFNIAYAFLKYFEAHIRGENLLNADCSEAYGYNGVKRNFYGGGAVNLRF